MKLANHQDAHKILIPKYSQKKKKKIPCLIKILPRPKILFRLISWPIKNSMSIFFFFPMTNQNLSMSDSKNPYHHKIFFSHTHVQKNVHTHEIRLTHSNKISAFIKNEFVQPSLHIKFSWLQCPQNSSQNTFNIPQNSYTAKFQWVINIVQVTPCQIA